MLHAVHEVKRVGHNWATELNWVIINVLLAYWSTVFLLWRIFSGIPPLIWQSCLFVWYWVVRAVNIFWRWTHVSCIICKDFLPVSGLSFHFVMVSFLVWKLSSLNRSYLVILFLFVFPCETNRRKNCWDLYQRIFCLYSLLGVLWYHI